MSHHPHGHACLRATQHLAVHVTVGLVVHRSSFYVMSAAAVTDCQYAAKPRSPMPWVRALVSTRCRADSTVSRLCGCRRRLTTRRICRCLKTAQSTMAQALYQHIRFITIVNTMRAAPATVCSYYPCTSASAALFETDIAPNFGGAKGGVPVD